MSPAAAAPQQRMERFRLPAEDAAFEPRVVIIETLTQRPAILLAAGGVAGGALLGGVGALVGYSLGCGTTGLTSGMPEDDYCGILAFPGFIAGELIGVPLGVWLANGRQGNVGADMIASLGALLVGSGAALLSGPGAWIVLPLVPIAQIVAVIVTERATAD